jgi:hypothetical protein
MRSSVVHRVGGQRPLSHTHDMEMWLRLAAVSDVARIHGADQALHREHEASRSARMVDAVIDLRERRDAFLTLFEWTANHAPEVTELRNVALAALSNEALRRACQAYARGRGADDDVQDLVTFALETVEDPTTLQNWRRWRAHERAGTLRSRFMPHFIVQALCVKAAARWRSHRWHRTGM